MATDNKSSILVDELLPEFLETEGPKFKSFVRAYYEFLETTGQLTERSKNLLNYADIDRTNAEFVKYFDREILANFPQEILANKKLVAARIKEVYRAKGSEQAYKMLFRMLFDDEIEFYYPGQDILRVSDGRWVQENSIRLSLPFTGNLFDIGGRNVVGLSSGATAIVERVQKTFEQGVEVFELFISNVRGIFQDTEIVQTSDGSLSGVILGSIGPLQGVIVDFGGSSHRVGDIVNFDSVSGVAGRGVVQRVDDSSIIPVVIDGGSGFSVNAVITITGGSGSGAQFKVDTISNTEILFGYDDIIAGLENTLIEANTFGSSNSATISANLAISTANTVLSAALGTSNIEVGTIATMSAITRGSGFNLNALPTVVAIDPPIAEQFLDDGSGGIKGFNATLSSNTIGGSITSVGVTTPGAGYARIDPVTIVNLTRNAQNATGAAQVTGFIEYPGKYVDTKGFLSWNNRLQDNIYYQQFSYVVRSQQNVNTYREILKKLLHPAGTNLFGDLLIQSNVSTPLNSQFFLSRLIEFIFDFSIPSTASVDGGGELVHVIDYSSVASTLSVPNPQFAVIIDVLNVPTTTVVNGPSVSYVIAPSSIASTTVVNLDKELVFIIDYTTKISTLSIPNPELLRTVDFVNIPTTSTVGVIELVHIVDYSSIGSTLSIPNHELSLTLTDINVPTTTSAIANIELVHIIDPVSITSTAVINTNNELVFFVDYSSIGSTLSIPNHELLLSITDVNAVVNTSIGIPEFVHVIDPVSIVSTTVVNQDKELVFIIDYTTKISTLSIPNHELLLTIDNVGAVVNTSIGIPEFVHIIDPVSIASTTVVNQDKELVFIIDYTTKISTLSIPNHELLLTIDNVGAVVNTSIGIPEFVHVIDPVSIVSTLSIPNHEVLLTIDDINVPATLAIANIEFVHIIDPVSIASTTVVNTDKEIVFVIDYTTKISTLSIPNPELLLTIDDIDVPSTLAIANIEFVHIIDPVSIASTTVVNQDKELVFIIDYTTTTSTLSIPNHELLLTVDDINVPATLAIANIEFVHVIDPVSIASTLSIPVAEVLLTVLNINIPTATSVPQPIGVFLQGDGSVTNFFVNTIEDLSTEQIAKYGNLTINSVPGNRIFDGTGTSFSTQLVPGSVIQVIDINNTNETFALIVNSINGNSALSVTANVVYSNSSFAIVNNAIYLYN